jgi:hypothetical protein
LNGESPVFFLLCSRAADVGGRALAFGLSVLVLATPLVTFLLLPATGVDVPRDQQHRKKQYVHEPCAGFLLGSGTSNTTTPNTFFNVTYTALAGDSRVAADNYFRAPAAICSSNAIILFVLRI